MMAGGGPKGERARVRDGGGETCTNTYLTDFLFQRKNLQKFFSKKMKYWLSKFMVSGLLTLARMQHEEKASGKGLCIRAGAGAVEHLRLWLCLAGYANWSDQSREWFCPGGRVQGPGS